MSVYFEKLRVEHILDIELQAQQQSLQAQLTPEYAHSIVDHTGFGWAALLDGKTIACAGVLEFWANRGQGWALLSEVALANFIAIHRFARCVLRDQPFARVEIFVDQHHDAGIRWAERLGFEREGLMRRFTTDGRDCFLYAKVDP